MNFILTQSAAFYELAGRLEQSGCGGSQPENRLVSMQAVPVEGPRSRPEMDVVFSFQSMTSGAVQHWFQRVDVGGAFMFLVTEQVQPYFQRPAERIVPQALGGAAPQGVAGGSTWNRMDGEQGGVAVSEQREVIGRDLETGAGRVGPEHDPGPENEVGQRGQAVGRVVEDPELDEARLSHDQVADSHQA